MENKEPATENGQKDLAESPTKEETTKNATDEASKVDEIKASQNGETEGESAVKETDKTQTEENPEESKTAENSSEENKEPESSSESIETDDTSRPVEETSTELSEKQGRTTRGTKRKAETEKSESSVELTSSETAEHKENESKNNDSFLTDDSSIHSLSDKDSMGKGKRARIPNKRYSDILLTPNKKSAKQHEAVDTEITIKEEPLDSPIFPNVGSPSLPPKKIRNSLPKENLQDPKYLKPFKYGWKRELVWRSTSTASKPVGDIYYYTPSGKKVRSFRELADLLTNKNLSMENFTYTKEPLGVNDPEKEIIRSAKIGKSSDSISETPTPKKVEVKKPPKKVLSPKSSVTDSPKVNTRIKRKIDSPVVKDPPPSPSKKVQKMPAKKGKTPPAKKPKLAAVKPDEPVEVAPSPPARASTIKTSKPCQPCSIRCDGLQGVIPTLQCRLCLCLYHHECVGMDPNITYPYVCKNCQDQDTSSATMVAPPPLTPINTLKAVSTSLPTSLPKLQRIPRPDSTDPVPVLQPLANVPQETEISAPIRAETPKLVSQSLKDSSTEVSKSLLGGVTSWLPHNAKLVNSEEPTEAPRPQYLEYLGGRKFLVIPKHNYMSVSASNPGVTRAVEPAIPSPLQPTEIPMTSASLGPSTVLHNIETTEKSQADSSGEIKKEPPSPTKADETQSVVPGEVNSAYKKCENAQASSSQKNQDLVDLEMDDESNQNNSMVKLNKRNLKVKSITNTSTATPEEKSEAKFMENYLQNLSFGYNTLLYVFQYLKVQDLLRAGCVCTMWRDIASHPILWRTVRMKNSQVHSFEGLANTLKKHGTVHLDLRKMLLPSSGDEIWPEFSSAIAKVDTLKKIELCRCPASVVEQLATSNTNLEVINAVTIKCESMNLDPLKSLTCIRELRLKSTSGLNINSIDSLKELKTLKILSLTSVNDLSKLNLEVIAELTNLESLDLGECTDFPKSFGQDILAKLENLEKLRLEKGQGNCHTFEILEAVKGMKKLEQLELVNFDVKSGFDKALGQCTNIKKLMIIPTYISQSATTNNMVLSGVLRLQESLTHFVWGVTLELLRVTELFVDQCEDFTKKEKKPTGNGDSIPVLKPVPDLSHGGDIQAASNPPQVEILPLPNLQKLLLNSLPTTRVKILKIPFHATWRQTLTDSV